MQGMASNELFPIGADRTPADCAHSRDPDTPSSRPADAPLCPTNPPSATRSPQSSCTSCGSPGHACGAMPEVAHERDVTLACTWCFIMPLVVVVAAVVLLQDVVGEVAACLLGAAAWLVLLGAGKFISQFIRAHRSGA